MRHAYMYSGSYETNYSDLTPGSNSYKTTDGNEVPMEWPDKIDGIRVSYMEKSGKKFYAVRVQHDTHDVILENPVHLDPERHMNNRRLTANPLSVTDDEASALLDDIIRDNPEKQSELALMINRINSIRRASRALPEQ
ncbi:MAG TPA: hypothetical protein VGM82_23125 [Gemmatimonadaceae bacterium]